MYVLEKNKNKYFKSYMKQVQNLYRTIFVDRIEKSEFVELVNLDFGKYKNVSHYGFNAVCKEKQYDWVCYMVTFGSVYNWIRNKRYVF